MSANAQTINEFYRIKDYLSKDGKKVLDAVEYRGISNENPHYNQYRTLQGYFALASHNEGTIDKGSEELVRTLNVEALKAVQAAYHLADAFGVEIGTLTKAPTTYERFNIKHENFLVGQAARDEKIKTGFDELAAGLNAILFHEEYGIASLKKTKKVDNPDLIRDVNTYSAEAGQTSPPNQIYTTTKLMNIRRYVNASGVKVWKVVKEQYEKVEATLNKEISELAIIYKTLKVYFERTKTDDTQLLKVFAVIPKAKNKFAMLSGINTFAEFMIERQSRVNSATQHIVKSIKKEGVDTSGMEHSIEQLRDGIYRLTKKIGFMQTRADRINHWLLGEASKSEKRSAEWLSKFNDLQKAINDIKAKSAQSESLLFLMLGKAKQEALKIVAEMNAKASEFDKKLDGFEVWMKDKAKSVEDFKTELESKIADLTTEATAFAGFISVELINIKAEIQKASTLSTAQHVNINDNIAATHSLVMGLGIPLFIIGVLLFIKLNIKTIKAIALKIKGFFKKKKPTK